MKDQVFKFTLFMAMIGQLGIFAGLVVYANKIFEMTHTEVFDFDVADPLYIDQEWLEAHPIVAENYELYDLTDKGKMFLVIFQTFAYLEIFNILNARRPSVKDLNPLGGISFLTIVALIFLLGF